MNWDSLWSDINQLFSIKAESISVSMLYSLEVGMEKVTQINHFCLIHVFSDDSLLGFFDVQTAEERWLKISPVARKEHTLTYSPFDNKVYLFGGWNPLEWNHTDAYFNTMWTITTCKMQLSKI